jgi:hypothetical protein
MKRQSQLLTNLLFSLPVAAGLLCAAPSASAQTAGSAAIPFAFSADNVQAPAGTYKVERLSNFLLSLENVETGKTRIVALYPEGGRVVQTEGSLVFHRDGTQYSLTQVKIAGSSIYGGLAVHPKPLHETAKITPAVATVEIAMK